MTLVTSYLQVRFICAPRKFQFFIGPMNLVDLFAILPFFLDLIIGGLQVSDLFRPLTNYIIINSFFSWKPSLNV